jgi:hypothetical protein
MMLQSAATLPQEVVEPNLLLISVFAFIAVFLLLSLLAGIMRLLTVLFPGEPDGLDAAVLAAITTAAAAAHPRMRVTGIEEIR